MSEPSKAYRVLFEPVAWDAIMALPAKVQERVMGAIEALERAPRPSGVVKLEGPDDLYRVRVGGYRIISANSRCVAGRSGGKSGQA